MRCALLFESCYMNLLRLEIQDALIHQSIISNLVMGTFEHMRSPGMSESVRSKTVHLWLENTHSVEPSGRAILAFEKQLLRILPSLTECSVLRHPEPYLHRSQID